ncbi:chitin synthase [Plakobranchus ocellatus]|uniref:chitin synthase n=1 Tax=Plakobranchus ocellatus TaxID=259542 RepID=A0AAV4APM8_9GAST|nr:chitin synthase [Plakobranchus ocellatus]
MALLPVFVSLPATQGALAVSSLIAALRQDKGRTASNIPNHEDESLKREKHVGSSLVGNAKIMASVFCVMIYPAVACFLYVLDLAASSTSLCMASVPALLGLVWTKDLQNHILKPFGHDNLLHKRFRLFYYLIKITAVIFFLLVEIYFRSEISDSRPILTVFLEGFSIFQSTYVFLPLFFHFSVSALVYAGVYTSLAFREPLFGIILPSVVSMMLSIILCVIEAPTLFVMNEVDFFGPFPSYLVCASFLAWGWAWPYILNSSSLLAKPYHLLTPHKVLFTDYGWSPVFTDQTLLTAFGWFKDPSQVTEKRKIKTRIYICTTMYRETDYEMKRLLQSLIQLTSDPVLEDVYFESNIFMDNGCKGVILTEFALQFVSLLDKIAGISMDKCRCWSTPYGMQITCKLAGGFALYLHLKDPQKVKVKKRWSQSMYINYVMKFRKRLWRFDSNNGKIQTQTADAALPTESHIESSRQFYLVTTEETGEVVSNDLNYTLKKITNVGYPAHGDFPLTTDRASKQTSSDESNSPSSESNSQALSNSSSNLSADHSAMSDDSGRGIVNKGFQEDDDVNPKQQNPTKSASPGRSAESTQSSQPSSRPLLWVFIVIDPAGQFLTLTSVLNTVELVEEGWISPLAVLMTEASSWSTLLCLHVYRPFESATLHELSTCSVVCLPWHSGNVRSSFFPHRTRFAFEAPKLNALPTLTSEMGIHEAGYNPCAQVFAFPPSLPSNLLQIRHDVFQDVIKEDIMEDIGKDDDDIFQKVDSELVDDDHTFILATDADMAFRGEAVKELLQLCESDLRVGAACGRTHPIGKRRSPIVWHQVFEYAKDFWMIKSAQNIIGSVSCCPGCFSLYRASAISDVMDKYSSPTRSPFTVYVKDTGEDRWMATLMMINGWRMRYSPFADNSTYCPDTFEEYYKQRKRWILSDMANAVLAVQNILRLVRNNECFSLVYVVYLVNMFLNTVITPGTAIVMITAGLELVFDIPYVYTTLPLASVVYLFAVLCTCTSHHTQIIASTRHLQTVPFSSTEALTGHFHFQQHYMILLLALSLMYAALMHPRESYQIVYGFAYLFIFPAMHVLLPLYSIANIIDQSWGTRDENKAKIPKLSCMPNLKRIIKLGKKAKEGGRTHDTGAELQSAVSVRVMDMSEGGERAVQEHKFWQELVSTLVGVGVNTGLEKAALAQGLRTLRNRTLGTFLALNALWLGLLSYFYLGADSPLARLNIYGVMSAALYGFTLAIQLVGLTASRLEQVFSRLARRVYDGDQSVPVWVHNRDATGDL